jgi:Tfp pilus assembly protein PilX
MSVPLPRRPRGFVIADALIGLFVVAALAFILTSAARDHGRVSARMIDQADALRQAQAVLQQLRSGEAAVLPEGSSIRPLSVADTPPGRQWVEVSVSGGRKTVTLTGLVPAGAALGRQP